MKPIVGSIVALVTPMHQDGSVDYDALRRLIDWHIAEGTDCIGVVGTTGESPTVSMQENCEIIRVAVLQAAGRVPIMAGTGANSTREAIELSRFAKEVGADCSLSVVPYYNKPSQEGIYQHFKTISEAVDLPIVLYNVPSRTVADMLPETALRLAALPGFIGLKEATGNIERAAWLIKQAPEGFKIYSGDEHGSGPDAARRARQRERHGQRRAAAHARDVHGRHCRQRQGGGAHSPATAAAAQGLVRGVEPGTDQVRVEAARRLRRCAAAAHHAADRAGPGRRVAGDAGGGPHAALSRAHHATADTPTLNVVAP